MSIQGLTESEVLSRRAQGLGNDSAIGTGRTYGDIIRHNVFTFINIVLFTIGLILVLLGRYSDAFVSVGLVFMNVVVGVVQEIRAKRILDQIALLTRPKAAVIREGQERIIDPAEIVVGDILKVEPGDQIVVDGEVTGASVMQVDESLLTGESDLIPKTAGDPVFSGSFCVTGSALYEAQKVGEDCFANKLTASARAYRQIYTPLQRDIDFTIRVLAMMASFFGILFAVSYFIQQTQIVESVKIAAVVAGLVPNGLFFMVTVAYAMGAVRMAGKGALIQQSNAVESMSHVNVLCLDKTGTLTSNRIKLYDVQPLALGEDKLTRRLADYVRSAGDSNRTADAIKEALDGQARAPVEEIPFSSARKWSAMTFDSDDMRGVYALGAPEMLAPYLLPNVDLGEQGEEWVEGGYRVLLFAHKPEVELLHDSEGEPVLPAGLTPLGFIAFTDELRPDAQMTLKQFADAGIRLKVISGDNAETVAALAKQAGFPPDVQIVSGLELEDMDDAAFAQTAEDVTIFGRITPQQKQRLVNTLREAGHYVAMIGDGVNDVLSLKQAQVGVAMQGGSQATRSVADIILIEDSFASLPPAFLEGQRILTGMQDIMRIFLTRVFYVALLILSVAVIGLGFPFAPKHGTILTLLTVGIPTFALAAWARPGKVPRGGFLRSVVHFVLPASFTIAMAALGVYLAFYIATYWNTLDSYDLPRSLDTIQHAAAFEAETGFSVQAIIDEAQQAASAVARTALTAITVFCGLFLLPFVEPPSKFWVAGDSLSGDKRPTVLALAMLGIFFAVIAVPGVRDFFEMEPLAVEQYALIGSVAVGWALILRFIWRARLFDRFLNVKLADFYLD